MAIPTTGLEIEYKFDGNANDTSGNSRTGTREGTATYTTGTGGQQCASFISTRRVYSPSISGGNSGTTYSVSFWINTTEDPSSQKRCWSVYDGGATNTFVSPKDTTNKFFFGANFEGTTTSDINTGERKHIVYTRKTGTNNGKVYVNGSLENTHTPYTSYETISSKVIRINGYENSTNQTFTFLMQGFRFYSVELSSTDVTNLYNEYSSGVKTVDGLARASVKTKNGLAIASIKTFNGLA